MTNIIEELFYGNIDPNTSSFDPKSEYGKALKTITENEDMLLQTLEGKEKALLVGFSGAHAQLNSLTALEKFNYGFVLGVSLTIDVYSQRDILTRL